MSKRQTGTFRLSSVSGEEVKAFIPYPLPPKPAIEMTTELIRTLDLADQKCRLLNLASQMLPERF